MGNVHNMTHIKIGKHSSTTDFTSVPGTFYTPEWQGDAASLLPRDNERQERGSMSVNNYRQAPYIGNQDLSPITLKSYLKGLAVPTGGPSTGLTGVEMGPLFDCFFGASATNPSGAQTTATGGNGTTTVVLSAANYSAGDYILFKTSVGWIANQVASVATTTLTLVFPYAATVTPGEIVYRGPRWALSRAVTEHIHAYIDAEGESWRRGYKGCIHSKMSIDVPIGSAAMVTHEWTPSSYDVLSEAGPSAVTPMLGKTVFGFGNILIGSDSYCLKNVKVDLEHTIQRRDCMSSSNGVEGYKVMNKSVTYTGTLHLGNNGTVREVPDADVVALYAKGTGKNSADTKDVFIQLGNEAGGVYCFRSDVCDISFKARVDGGEEVVDFIIKAGGSICATMAVL